MAGIREQLETQLRTIGILAETTEEVLYGLAWPGLRLASGPAAKQAGVHASWQQARSILGIPLRTA